MIIKEYFQTYPLKLNWLRWALYKHYACDVVYIVLWTNKKKKITSNCHNLWVLKVIK